MRVDEALLGSRPRDHLGGAAVRVRMFRDHRGCGDRDGLPDGDVAVQALVDRAYEPPAVALAQPVRIREQSNLPCLLGRRTTIRPARDAPRPRQVCDVLDRVAGCREVEVNPGHRPAADEHRIVGAGIVMTDDAVAPESVRGVVPLP
jgi:hypothetical protein